MATTRSERATSIRKAHDETQIQFAARLNTAAEDLDLPTIYDSGLVSKIENEYREVSLEDAAVYSAVDPEDRGWFWFAFGRQEPAVRRRRAKVEMRDVPAPRPAAAERRKGA